VVTAQVAVHSPAMVSRAYAVCAKLARDHYENFPVASILLPSSMRPAIAAIYAFARCADDFADEPGYSDEQRLRLLDEWRRRLLESAEGSSATETPDDLIFVALADAMRRHDLPLSLFEDLLSAFRQDVTVKRYRTWHDVLDYCSRSANPVGRLVLRVAGANTAAADRASDAVCTALQLTNFWQDFERDWKSGRLYVPLADRDAVGAVDADLDARTLTPAWRAALGTVASRTRELFAAGRPICDAVSGRLGLELRLTWLGGTRILDRLEENDFDVFRQRPTLSAADVPPLLWRALIWRTRDAD
jgi:squalene synthase HpnC